MNSELPPFDIFFLAIIAGYLIYKLYSVLGQNSEGGKSPQMNNREKSNIFSFHLHKNAKDDSGLIIDHEPLELQGLKDIQKADSYFEVADFLKGAKVAFAMIIEAFNKGNIDTIRQFLHPSIYKRFMHTVTQRKKAKEIWEASLLRIKSADIIEAEMKGSEAFITIKFVSEQAHVVQDEEGQIIEGDSDQVETITDLWTFSRDIHSKDPNWQLFKTETSF